MEFDCAYPTCQDVGKHSDSTLGVRKHSLICGKAGVVLGIPRPVTRPDHWVLKLMNTQALLGAAKEQRMKIEAMVCA